MIAAGHGSTTMPIDGQPVEDHEQLHEQRRAADDGDVEPRDARQHPVGRDPHQRHAEREHAARSRRRPARAGSSPRQPAHSSGQNESTISVQVSVSSIDDPSPGPHDGRRPRGAADGSSSLRRDVGAEVLLADLGENALFAQLGERIVDRIDERLLVLRQAKALLAGSSVSAAIFRPVGPSVFS